MTITLTGHRSIRRSDGRSTRSHTTPDALAASSAPVDEPPLCSLGSTFDDTAWAAALGCRPVFARRSR